MSQSAISLAIDNGVAIATMTNAKGRNAFTPAFIHDMKDLVATCRGDNAVEALIVTGTDGVFSAGGDIKGMVERAHDPDTPIDDTRRRLYDLNGWLGDLRNLEIPVIAAVDGPAYGGGFGLALCADFIVASERAEFCSVFCRIGAVPDCGVLFALPRMIGMQRAKELMYTGRALSAREAKDIGIVMDVVAAEDLRSEALALARRLQNASPTAFAITKRAANRAFENDAAAVVDIEANGQAVCLAGDYHKDAVRRFVEKRPLRFNWEAG